MTIQNRTASFLLGLWGLANAFPALSPRNDAIASNTETSLTAMFQNNLNGTDDINHIPFLVLDPVPEEDAAAACEAFGETLLSKATVNKYKSDFDTSLGYLDYSGQFGHSSQIYQIQGAVVVVDSRTGTVSYGQPLSPWVPVPVLCTQSNAATTANASNEIVVRAGTNNFIGFRSPKSFQFIGIPYANPHERWEYSSVYSQTHQTIQATVFGSECAQTVDTGSEACLFLNIYTPFLPRAGTSENLRPVMLWIHGGAYTGGAGSQTDGTNIVSREDIIFVTINYRLSTLGFLAIPGTSIKGNYGIGDQITALKWVVENIAAFGGDPSKITIVGESAGASSVRVLLGSPPAIGKFRGGISMSNLGGGVALGLSSDYSTTYSSYLTIAESYSLTQGLFAEAGCNQSSLDAQISCLKDVPALDLVELPIVARYVVQDGTYVNTEQLIVNVKNASTAHVAVMFGVMANDGSSFIQYPTSPVASEISGLESTLFISPDEAQKVISSNLFPFPNTGNLTLDTFNVSARIFTDAGFRCVDEATVYAGRVSDAFTAAYFYEFDRGIGGFDPNNVGTPPITPGYPLGNPNLPYFRVHAADVGFTFATVGADQYRDPQDLYYEQLVSGYWAEFTKSLQPNPALEYLQVRGYTNTIEAIKIGGSWDPIVQGSRTGPVKRLNWPPVTSDYLEVEQCTYLNYSLTYYLDSNRG